LEALVLKRPRGFRLTQRYYESAGWEVFGREVQVRLPNGNKIYPDFLFGNKTTGELILVDAKGTTGKRYYQEPGQRADWKLLEKEGGTITGGFRHPGQGGGFASPEVQRKLTGMRLAPGTRVGVSAWRVPKGASVPEMVSAGEMLEGVTSMPLRQLAITSRLMGVLSSVTFVYDIYHYFAHEKAQIDQGWSPCRDAGNGLATMALCPPGSSGPLA
jgi:hypothetical protein